MKPFLYISLLLVTTTLTSCINELVPTSPQGSSAMEFVPVVEMTTYPDSLPFGVWAYSLPAGEQWGHATSDAKPVLTNSYVGNHLGHWHPDASTLWHSHEWLTFFAYAPYDAHATFSIEDGIQFTDINTLTPTDELYFTPPISDCERNQYEGLVPLIFTRALSRVAFQVRSVSPDDMVLHLRSLSLRQVRYRGDFHSLPLPMWMLHKDTANIEYCTRELTLSPVIQPVAEQLMMPQSLPLQVDLVLDAYYPDGQLMFADQHVSTDVKPIHWQIGKRYSYTLNVSLYEASFTTDIFHP